MTVPAIHEDDFEKPYIEEAAAPIANNTTKNELLNKTVAGGGLANNSNINTGIVKEKANNQILF
jgi:hypothetical protein